ncbi:hypothetical protein PR048_021292 [Dryococelus australis]|uniref:Uncharacterized protein n=1 Tax=Dryococelus australis TaxID=614101 RepID=A0ABQ9GXU5_9NEOP|nr:hypothetical protein PR048_021292 [Dryococelus australis]
MDVKITLRRVHLFSLVSTGTKGWGNGRPLRKPADQRHRPARFPLAKWTYYGGRHIPSPDIFMVQCLSDFRPPLPALISGAWLTYKRPRLPTAEVDSFCCGLGAHGSYPNYPRYKSRQGQWKQNNPEKTFQSAALSGTIPIYENPGVTRRGLKAVRLGGRRADYPLSHHITFIIMMDHSKQAPNSVCLDIKLRKISSCPLFPSRHIHLGKGYLTGREDYGRTKTYRQLGIKASHIRETNLDPTGLIVGTKGNVQNALHQHEHIDQPAVAWTPGCVDESLESSLLFRNPAQYDDGGCPNRPLELHIQMPLNVPTNKRLVDSNQGSSRAASSLPLRDVYVEVRFNEGFCRTISFEFVNNGQLLFLTFLFVHFTVSSAQPFRRRITALRFNLSLSLGERKQ